MEKKRPRAREKRVTPGSGSVYKRGSAQKTGGPVGSGSGYQERRRSGEGGTARKTVTRGGLGSVGLILLVLLALKLFSGGGDAAGELLGDAAGALLSGNEQQSQTELVEYAEDTSGQTLSGVQAETAANASVSGKARKRYTTVRGGGRDVFTIMVYMCGTDLESNYGMATNDLNEMLKAKISDQVNLIVETGGCKKWMNSVISNSTNQRYQVTSDGLKRLDKNVGKRAMTDPATLADFIRYCKETFPADRYALILWDHGGGSLAGYGYDELYGAKGAMTLDKFCDALNKAGCRFDFIGFDACLMATVETAVAAEPYADYLIASEETEPGVGWYYTNWLTKLSQNTSMDTVEIGKNIIDDFVTVCYKNSPSDKTTLSITDLAEFSGTVPPALTAFAAATSKLVDSDDYRIVSDARANCREFSPQNKLNQVDLIHLAKNMGTKEALALADALSGAVKYNRTSRSMTNSYGLSIYFPYQKLSGVSSMLSVYQGIGMDESYGDCIKDFASIVSAGQVAPASSGNSGTGSLLGALLGEYSGALSGGSASDGLDVASLLTSFLSDGDFASIIGGRSAEWVDRDLIKRNAERIANTTLAPDRLVYTVKNGQEVLALTEEEWGLVQTIELNVFYDDGEGFIDLGLDNVYTFNADGDLAASYDGTWLALNGHIVPYYLIDSVEDGDAYSIRGRVPAYLNGERVELILLFDDRNPYGVVAGARRVYENGETDAVMRGLIALRDGDTLDFLCDYYDYDGNYQASYMMGDRFVVDGEIEISNVAIEDNVSLASFRLTDIYGNAYWTPTFTN